MENFKSFLKTKDIEISVDRYLIKGLSSMALGLFASLLIGIIFKTLGEQLIIGFGQNEIFQFFIDIGSLAMSAMGSAIGVAVALGLNAPSLVVFASIVTGMAGATLGGPAGAFIVTAIGVEFGKAVHKETKVDILVTPAVTLLVGFFSAKLVAPIVGALMSGLGIIIMNATELQPFLMGIVIAIIMGLVLTAPISSAALCIMLGLSGLAGGASTVGCTAQMVGFAVISFRANGFGGLVAQGLGTSMLQIPNIVKNPWILVPPTIAGGVAGALSTTVFKMTNIPIGAGMGSAGLVGQIGTFKSMGFTAPVLFKVLILHLIIPIAVALIVDYLLNRWYKVHWEDYRLKLA